MVPGHPAKVRLDEKIPDSHVEESDNASEPPKLGDTGSRLEKAGRKRELLIAFAFIFVPMAAVAFTLIAFVYYEKDRIHFNRESGGTPELPAVPVPPSNSYYTKLLIGAFLLVSSWGSTAAGIVFAPFMLLFSFVVARELVSKYDPDIPTTKQDEYLLKEILSGSWNGVLHWVEHGASRLVGREHGPTKLSTERRATHMAGAGLVGTGILSLLVIVGDNWLHLSTTRENMRYFDDPTFPAQNASASPQDPFAAGWTTVPSCETQLTTVLPENRSDGAIPCSINATNGLNVAYAPYTYLTLDTGISQVTSGFNGINFAVQLKSENEALATNEQVIIHVDPATGLTHAMLFYPDASIESDRGSDQLHYGLDYVANSTSLVTQCEYATESCQLVSKNASTASDPSVPYNCSSFFSGDLNQPPLYGLERAKGWNMSVYEIVNGNPSAPPLQAQANPFFFVAAAAVSSISYSNVDLANVDANTVVDAGQGRVALALACNATMYDIQYSMINGSIAAFNATASDPRKANIAQAPLQIGFGQYALFQATTAAAIANVPFLDHIAVYMSQIGMAGASAAFQFDVNVQQRFRWDVAVTRVPFAPFWFIVVSCLLYAACGIVIVVAAFMLRTDEKIRRRQSELLPQPELEESFLDRVRDYILHPLDTIERYKPLFGVGG